MRVLLVAALLGGVLAVVPGFAAAKSCEGAQAMSAEACASTQDGGASVSLTPLAVAAGIVGASAGAALMIAFRR